jgi:Domain of unknown function (DUF4260)
VLDRLPRVLLRAEGLTLAVAALVVYFHNEYGWVPFLVLVLAPDLSIGGYAFGPRVGALLYDLVHTEIFPLALVAGCVASDAERGIQVGLIWLTHIGADRLLGYGLKYPTTFQDTHLQRV